MEFVRYRYYIRIGAPLHPDCLNGDMLRPPGRSWLRDNLAKRLLGATASTRFRDRCQLADLRARQSPV